MSFDHKLDINIPFEEPKQATIAKKSLEPDPIMRPDDIRVRFLVEESSLVIKFEATTDRTLRVAASSVLESLKTVIETIDEFQNAKDQLL
ncbi:CYFA0S17e01816g1_1 [Cyberlindnera fabianii]|uniref:CYFA0S17e01816g1_1 n=1 Tax=Cyberlindnera fabianii TaxID=36022 RepID=A0A061BBS0_CYBFA|nr:EKC/KEOPS complex subunit PCC1 [Cyberlindnera fabianii]CDR45332.1 CYFA0S17e01816g1_1 [Cyberlindnera fabianii]